MIENMKRGLGLGVACAWVIALGGCDYYFEKHSPPTPDETESGEAKPLPVPDAAPPRPPGEGFEEPAACDADCCGACSQFATCTNSQSDFDECMTICSDSLFVPSNGVHCLALRIYWIDEEGCESIVATYDAFEPDDDCTGPRPAVR